MRVLPERIDSKFRFILVAAQRAEQLLLGARPRVEAAGQKLTRIAQEEVFEDAVVWDYGPEPEPEVEAPPDEAVVDGDAAAPEVH